MTKKTQEVQIIDLDTFSTSQLPELQNKKAELKKAIDEFPFVEITDTASYELAKKSRTGVKTIRTGLEKEKKMVIGKLKEKVLNVVSDEYDSLLAEEVVPIENRYQAEVTRYEDEKEQERQEKLKQEESRILKIKTEINLFEVVWNESIQNLIFEDIQKLEESLKEKEESYDYASLQEFEIEFKAKLAFLRTKLEDKVKTLTEKENIRLEQERLAEERKENERKQNIRNAIALFFSNWERTVYSATDKNIISSKAEFDAIIDLDYKEFQEEYNERKLKISELFEERRAVIDLQKEQAKKAEEQRIAQENFAKEKREFEDRKLAEEKKLEDEKKEIEKSKFQLKTDSRIKQLRDLGLEFDFNTTFEGAFGGVTFFIDLLDIKTYDDEKWDSIIAKINEKKNQPEEIFPDCLPERPITQEDAFEPETNPNDIEVIEDASEIEQPNVIDEEKIMDVDWEKYHVATMTFQEKRTALIDWISNREEYELDALIEQYLN